MASGVASPICWGVGGGGQSKRPLPFLPDFPSFSQFFPLFPNFPPLFLDFGKYFAVRGALCPPWPPSCYATENGGSVLRNLHRFPVWNNDVYLGHQNIKSRWVHHQETQQVARSGLSPAKIKCQLKQTRIWIKMLNHVAIVAFYTCFRSIRHSSAGWQGPKFPWVSVN